MNNFTFLLKLTENDKRLALAFGLVLVAILAIFIILALLIERVAKKQGERIETMMHDLVMSGMIETKKKFISIANKKNMIYFYRHSRIAMGLLFLHFISAIIYISVFSEFTYAGLFTDYETYGLATIFPIYDWENPIYTNFFGIGQIITGLGDPISTPHFSIYALYSYISIPVLFVGGIMFLFQVQGFLARTIKTHLLAKKIYSKKLDNVKVSEVNGIQVKENVVTVSKDSEDKTSK
jgi:hypothetical protein